MGKKRMRTTTIQIEQDTKALLNELKTNFESKTYDDVIKALVRHKSKSMYGKASGTKKISFKKMMHGLRDKHDRF
jgi:predicted CopG family antitoxin